MNFIIIHGVYNDPNGNWFPWLKKELESQNHEVIVPKFPTPIGQNLETWLKVMEKYEDKINERTVMIGHSLGAVFIVDYLEQSKKKIRTAFLVAGFHKNLKSPYDTMNRTFINKDFHWEKIKSSCKDIFVIASDNDEFIPIEMSRELSKNLNAHLEIVHKGGHLNIQAGYREFPLLLEMIEKLQ